MFYQIWPLVTTPLLVIIVKDIAVLPATCTHLALSRTALLAVVLLVSATLLEVLVVKITLPHLPIGLI